MFPPFSDQQFILVLEEGEQEEVLRVPCRTTARRLIVAGPSLGLPARDVPRNFCYAAGGGG